MLNIIGNRKYFYLLSGVLVGVAILAMLIFRFKEGVDFAGGTLWQFRAASGNTDPAAVQNIFNTDLSPAGCRSYLRHNQRNIPRAGRGDKRNRPPKIFERP